MKNLQVLIWTLSLTSSIVYTYLGLGLLVDLLMLKDVSLTGYWEWCCKEDTACRLCSKLSTIHSRNRFVSANEKLLTASLIPWGRQPMLQKSELDILKHCRAFDCNATSHKSLSLSLNILILSLLSSSNSLVWNSSKDSPIWFECVDLVRFFNFLTERWEWCEKCLRDKFFKFFNGVNSRS